MLFPHFLHFLATRLKRSAMNRMHRNACAFARQELPRAPMSDDGFTLTFSPRETQRLGRRLHRLRHS